MGKNIKKKNIIIRFREYITNKNQFITNILYVSFFMILMINLAVADWLAESLICSVFFTKDEKTMPIIDVEVEEKNYYVKYKEINTKKVSVITETDKIEIIPRKNYKKGENVTYYIYRLGNIEHTSIQNFDITKSLIGVLIFIIDTYVLINFMFIDNEKKKETPKSKQKRELPKDWNNYSRKDLLELCDKWELKIPKHKENNINYIKTMLRNNEDKLEQYNKKTILFDIFIIMTYIIAISWIMLYYIRIAKYFILLTL